MSQVRDLIRYAVESSELFHAPDGTVYASVEVDGHRETLALRSSRFADWILVAILPRARQGSQRPVGY